MYVYNAVHVIPVRFRLNIYNVYAFRMKILCYIFLIRMRKT